MIELKQKPCDECGTEFIPHSANARYCPGCVAKVRRRYAAERARRYRARTKEAEQNLVANATK